MSDSKATTSFDGEAIYRAVFDRLADALIIHAKADHRILDANPSALERLGYTLDELRQMTSFDLHPADERDLLASRIDWPDAESAHACIHVTKAGLHVPVEILSDEIVYKGVPAWLSIARDIRRRKAQEDKIAAAHDEAQASSRHKSFFIANISHELRTPMNGVIGMTSLLLDTNLDNEQREYAETVQQAASSMLELLNEVLDLAKIESGKLELDAVPFDLRQTLEGVYRILQPHTIENALEMLVDFDPTIPGRLVGDPLRLRQVILNLAANGLRFTHRGHVAIRALDRGRDGGDLVVEFRVEDTGIGIPETQLQSIFEAFQQVERSSSLRSGGTGLGLTISRRLVELMGGELHVESVEGQGSAFSFELRMPIYAALLEQNVAAATSHGDALVVHSDPNRREVLAAELKKQGLRAFMAPTASKALALLDAELASNTLQLAIVDYLLPDIDGETFAHSLVRRGVVGPGAVVLEGRSGVSLDPDRLRRRGIEALQSELGNPDLSQLIARLVLASPELRSGKTSVERASVGSVTSAHAGSEFAHASAKLGSSSAFEVLVVEDNPVNQRVIGQLLGKLGCCVDVAEHGLRAVELVQTKRYSIIFMDCQMPEMDGYAATAEIRRLNHPACGTPIVALTANAMDGDREKCLNCGMDDYLSKPATSKQIHGMLTKWAARPTLSTS